MKDTFPFDLLNFAHFKFLYFYFFDISSQVFLVKKNKAFVFADFSAAFYKFMVGHLMLKERM